MMSTLQTLRKPKAKRLRSISVPQSVEDVKEFSAEWYRRRTLELFEQRRQAGYSDDDPLDPDEPQDMDIIVAICKEARAERCAEDQAKKAAHCR